MRRICGMSETQVDQKNSAKLALPIVGGVTALVGVILWIVGGNQLAHDTNVNSFSTAMGGFATGNTSGDQVMIFAGLALLAVGAILLIARWVIAAAQK